MTDENLIDGWLEQYDDLANIEYIANATGFVAVPPTIEQFIDDEYYAGKFLGPNLFPTWREVLKQVYPNPFYSPYSEVILSGSIGAGKSSCAKAGMLYDLCRLFFLEDPHKTFQLFKTKPIVFAFMNTTLKLSESVLFREFNAWLLESPFFAEQAAKVKQVTNSVAVRLPHNVILISGSRGTHALGSDIYSGLLSELNFQGESHKLQAFNQYTQVSRRIESRFFRGVESMSPGRLWLDSSKTDEAGFLERHIRKSRDNPLALVIEKPIWEIMDRAGKVQYSGITFPVFIGDQTNDPAIIEPGADVPESLVLQVPEEYRPKFEFDLLGSLRDIAGVSTWSASRFFSQTSKVHAALNLPMNCSKYEIDLDFDDIHDRIINYVNVEGLSKAHPYYIHLDLGVKHDRTGIALTRSLGEIQISRMDTFLTEQVYQDCVFQTDLVLAIVPKPGKEVRIDKIKDFLIDLVRLHGIKIGCFSADQYQSKNLLQNIQALNHATEDVSVDRDRIPYDYLKTAIIEGRWNGPNFPLLERELLELEDLGKKIDHPAIEGSVAKADRPSKDLADAVCGSVYNCFQNSLAGKGFSALESFVNYQSGQQMKPKTMKESMMDAGLKQKLQKRRW